MYSTHYLQYPLHLALTSPHLSAISHNLHSVLDVKSGPPPQRHSALPLRQHGGSDPSEREQPRRWHFKGRVVLRSDNITDEIYRRWPMAGAARVSRKQPGKCYFTRALPARGAGRGSGRSGSTDGGLVVVVAAWRRLRQEVVLSPLRNSASGPAARLGHWQRLLLCM